jgi:C_GCAxxG_C_C family probable redox protein
MTENILFARGYNCSQSVLAEYASRLGITNAAAIKIASAFGGGIARSGRTCGAVSGALMVIGLRFGSVDAENTTARDLVYTRSQEFMESFYQVFGSLECRSLLGRDLSQPGEHELARSEDRFNQVCPKYINRAISILSEWIPV